MSVYHCICLREDAKRIPKQIILLPLSNCVMLLYYSANFHVLKEQFYIHFACQCHTSHIYSFIIAIKTTAALFPICTPHTHASGWSLGCQVDLAAAMA